ncbi:MAG: RIB43A-domain-containing protein [Olpidium bornovanus]|uniref:RIB43A-domain-containing protein n=1 Tax=Olpidium bornovanus TaxID=278681 RepID=A0A8H7ZZ73_9FUNG|nr:MAG: RIB43A-domain-containing protein [Olpidium bornovanus]
MKELFKKFTPRTSWLQRQAQRVDAEWRVGGGAVAKIPISLVLLVPPPPSRDTSGSPTGIFARPCVIDSPFSFGARPCLPSPSAPPPTRHFSEERTTTDGKMYKVEIIAEPDAQDLAVLRRREREEQRKRRIFNPKLRVIGIDVKALEEQIEAKNRRKLLNDLRDKNFESAVTNNNTILEVLEKRALRARREQLQEINKYRLANQRQEYRREYDLNMPSKQRNELLKMDGYTDNGAPPPVSGLQGFGGEDKEAAERARLQKEQMKVWMIENLLEKKKGKEKEAQEKR